MAFFTQAGDVPGLVYDIPPSVSNGSNPAAALLALGRQNANAIGAAAVAAIGAGQRRITFPERNIVVATQTAGGLAGRPPLYVNSAFGSGANEFFFHLEGTQFLNAGTDRTTVGGLAGFEGSAAAPLSGPCGFSGTGSIDYFYPMSASGVVGKVIDAQHFVVTLDHAIPWTDFVQALVYDPVYDRWLGRACYSGAPAPNVAGIPITLATGANQVTGTDYLVDLTTSAVLPSKGGGVDSSFIAVGTELAILHSAYANLIGGIACDKVVLPAELRIYQACNAVFVGQAASLDADCHCEARMITSAIASRGRFRRRLMASGGFQFTPTELTSSLGATIIGTADDGIDVAAFVCAVASVPSSSSLVVGNTSVCLPQPGQRVSLLDTDRTEQAVMTVRSLAVSNGSTTLAFTGTMPSGVSSAWSISPVTTSRGVAVKSSTRLQTLGSAGLRISAQDVRIADGAVIGPSMGPGVDFSDAGATEYAPLKRLHAGALHLTCANSGSGFEPFAAIYVHPRTTNDSAALPAGAFGEVHIDELIVAGLTNGPAAAFSSLSRLQLGRVTCETINQSPTAHDGLPTGAAITLENITYARIDELTQVEAPGAATILCSGVGTLVMGEAVDGPVPTSGVARLLAYGKYVPFTPTFTPASGSFGSSPPTAGTECEYRIDRNKNYTLKLRIDFPATLPTGSNAPAGPLTMTLPFTTGPRDYVSAVLNDERHRTGPWVITTNANSDTASIYMDSPPRGSLNNAGTLVAGAVLFGEISGRTA